MGKTIVEETRLELGDVLPASMAAHWYSSRGLLGPAVHAGWTWAAQVCADQWNYPALSETTSMPVVSVPDHIGPSIASHDLRALRAFKFMQAVAEIGDA